MAVKTEKVRKSNMEMLRIVSMLMVLAVHVDGASLGLPDACGDACSLDSRAWWRLVVEGFAIVGVNCFTMISGYFGVRLTWRSVVRFLSQCVFYSVGLYTAMGLYTGFSAPFSWMGWWESWMVITHSDLWYVPAYFLLMLLSPVLNAGFGSLDRRSFRILLAVMTAMTLWAGWWWKGSFNPSGYTIAQLVYVYAVARYIALHGAESVDGTPLRFFGIYLLAVAGVVATAIYISNDRGFAYNSPFVLLASWALFMCFRGMRFQSAVVNDLAKSAFSVYLIHKNPLVWGSCMKPACIWLWQTTPLWLFSVYAVVMILGIYVLCAAADSLRRRIMPW